MILNNVEMMYLDDDKPVFEVGSNTNISIKFKSAICFMY